MLDGRTLIDFWRPEARALSLLAGCRAARSAVILKREQAAEDFFAAGTAASLRRCGEITTEEPAMAKSSMKQRRTIGRVMHEFEHGELKSGPAGKAGPVKNRRQAVAIALSEAGASKYDSEKENKEHFARSARKEAEGATAQQEAEGNSKVGAAGKRESTPAMGGQNAAATTARGRKSARKRALRAAGATRDELYERAKARGVKGRSKMTKQQLDNALH
jgi:hypothetical protein